MNQPADRREQELETAIELATRAHAGQVDKAGAPYIEHPLRVMKRLPPGDFEGRIVAVLHDVLEDTEVERADLEAAGFSAAVCDALRALTHRDGEPNRIYWARVADDPLARRVKLADIADNSDESRLSKLPPDVAARLRAKYARAREALGDTAR